MKKTCLAIIALLVIVFIGAKLFRVYTRAMKSAPQKVDAIMQKRDAAEKKLIGDDAQSKPPSEADDRRDPIAEVVSQVLDPQGAWRVAFSEDASLDKAGRRDCNAALKYISQCYCLEAAKWHHRQGKAIMTPEERRKLAKAVRKNTALLQRHCPDFFQYAAKQVKNLKAQITPDAFPEFQGEELVAALRTEYIRLKTMQTAPAITTPEGIFAANPDPLPEDAENHPPEAPVEK